MDNLNTLTISSMYEAFPPDEARRQAKRLEINYAPKEGSWFNLVEIELSAMTKQCLKRRNVSIIPLFAELSAYEIGRKDKLKTEGWQFTTESARIKLKRLHLHCMS